MNKSFLFNVLRSWLPLACGLTLVCGLVYAAVQQNFRQNANDPQVQMAEDAVELLEQGVVPEVALDFAPSLPIEGSQVVADQDIQESLRPFLIIFDDQGQPLAASAVLHGTIPVPPKGVFDYVREHGEDRLTWQPQQGVRIAAIVTEYRDGGEIAAKFGGSKSGNGFVLAGRSLREVEAREANLTKQILLAWLAALLGTLVVTLGMELAAGNTSVKNKQHGT